MDRFECMEAFVASIDHGSLSRAASALGRSITTVSRAISALEERLGATLLIRTTRTLKLTDAGDRYLAACRKVLAELADAEQRAGSGVEPPTVFLRSPPPRCSARCTCGRSWTAISLPTRMSACACSCWTAW